VGALRSQVASQVGDLIWDTTAGAGEEGPVLVRRDSLLAVLAAAADYVARHGARKEPRGELLAALEDVRAALQRTAGALIETKTETRRPSNR
jgi:hypothetical protein